MKVLLALSLLFNVALMVWITRDMSREVASAPRIDANENRHLNDRLARSLMFQASGLRKQAALRDSLEGSAWLESQDRKDMIARAKELEAESRHAAFAAGTIPESDLGPPGD